MDKCDVEYGIFASTNVKTAKILIDQSNQLINRLGGDISQLKSRYYSLFSILLPMIAFQLTVYQLILTTTNTKFSIELNSGLILLFLGPMICSGFMLIFLITSTAYREICFFQPKGYLEQLTELNEEKVVKVILRNLRTTYNENFELYGKEVKIFKFSLYSFIIGIIIFILVIFLIMIN